MPEFKASSAGAVVLATVLPFVALTPRPLCAEVHLRGLDIPSGGGLEVVDESLARLSGNRRLLIVGAHPDDEDNALLTYVARELGGEVAYLSLSRGEGGQNLIGTELGVDLGVVRTGELLAARRIEGTRQYFTRARDFGYTRSLEETFTRWPRGELQIDALRVARRFRPQVVVSVFPESERARHGQHHAAAVIARDIYERAGDPQSAPGLEEEGLDPWRPQALFRRAWGDQEATVHYELGGLDPVGGRSLSQIAAASRSQHRSQDMGRAQSIGRATSGLVWLAGGRGEQGRGIFDGIDTSLASLARTAENTPVRERLEQILTAVSLEAQELRRSVSPGSLGAASGPLARMVERLAEAERLADGAGEGVAAEMIAEKRGIAERALLASAGVVLDAVCTREEIVSGEAAEVEVEIWPAGDAEVDVLTVQVVSNAKWKVGTAEHLGWKDDAGVDRWRVDVRVPEQAGSTQPYFLEQPLRGDLYDWSRVPAGMKGLPFQPAPLVAVAVLDVEGTEVRVLRDVVYRYADQALGEVRRPVRAVPPIEVAVGKPLTLWPRGARQRKDLEVILSSNVDSPVAGTIDLDVPEGWSIEGSRKFEIVEERGTAVRSLALMPERMPQLGRQSMSIRVRLDSGGVWGASFPVIEYPHVQPTAISREATVDLSVFDLELPRDLRLGYVRGAADRVPDVLESVGLKLTILDEEDLTLGDLTAFDVVVIGSRAYETNDTLRRANRRLVDFVQKGGTLVVQYQQYQFVAGGYAPLGLEIARPHGRVTDETAPVRVLQPQHAAFNRPNLIDESDWRGWVQERGLYFASEWDERFVPLLEMSDPGRESERGALLAGNFGDGVFVYTGLSFFRQLPAGVPGAIRLLVNLISLGNGFQ